MISDEQREVCNDYSAEAVGCDPALKVVSIPCLANPDSSTSTKSDLQTLGFSSIRTDLIGS
jgi:hypothetical protein